MAQIGLKPYRPQLTHGLLEDDPDRRLQFSELMLNKIEEDSGILDKTIWSEEASFKLSGHVNRHNCVYWYTDNMHLTLEKHLNQPGINVWGGMSSSSVYGPFFFLEGTMTGDKYLEMLKNQIIPQLEQLTNLNDFYFQQDGAPPHYCRGVREYLHEKFLSAWIG